MLLQEGLMPPALVRHGRLLPTHIGLRPGEATLGSLRPSQGAWMAGIDGRDDQGLRHNLFTTGCWGSKGGFWLAIVPLEVLRPIFLMIYKHKPLVVVCGLPAGCNTIVDLCECNLRR